MKRKEQVRVSQKSGKPTAVCIGFMKKLHVVKESCSCYAAHISFVHLTKLFGEQER